MEDFVPFEIAKKLKEKGFRELCLAYYTNDDILYYNYTHKTGARYKDCYLSHNLLHKDSVSGKFVDAPTISQVLKWLREEKKIHVQIVLHKGVYKFFWAIDYIDRKKSEMDDISYSIYDSHEQAALAGIEYVLDNLI